MRTFSAISLVTVTALLSSLTVPLSVLAATDAPPAKPAMTLVQALEEAVKGNIDLQRERINILSAQASIVASRGKFDFDLQSDLSFARTTTPPLTAQDLAGGYTNTWTADVGLNRALETGGSLRLLLRGNAVNTNARFNCGTSGGVMTSSGCTYYTSNLGLTFTHPLLQGFGTEIAQAQIRHNKIVNDQALLNRQMRVANVMRDVITGYWELAYSTRDLEIRQSAVDLAKEQLRVTKAQIEVGRLAPADSAAVERAISDRLQEVAISEQTLYFRTLDLRRLFGLTSDPQVAPLFAADMPVVSAYDIDPAQEIARTIENNPQLRALRMGQRLSEVDLQAAASNLKPTLNFVGSIGATARKESASGALSQTFAFENMTWSAGLSLDVPIENRVARGQARGAELALQRAFLESGDYEISLRDSVIRLASNIRTSAKRVELARAAVGFANQNLEAEKARFTVGRSTNNDVLLRQQELKTAEIQVVRATVDLLESEVQLWAVSGEILERYGVVLKGT